MFVYYLYLLQAIAPYLPKGDHKLSPAIYEMVLNEFLHTDEQVTIFSAIPSWIINLVNVYTVYWYAFFTIIENRLSENFKLCM